MKMFTVPKKFERLQGKKEVYDFSCRTEFKDMPYRKGQKDGIIAFSNCYGVIYITPYRPEIMEVLKEAGYVGVLTNVPLLEDDLLPEFNKFKKLADEQVKAYNCELANKIAYERHIKRCVIANSEAIEIIDTVEKDEWIITPLLDNKLFPYTNIGTYIKLDNSKIVLCDEYGRTFYVKVTNIYNALASLLEAGYTPTQRSDLYVKFIR